MTMVNRIEKSFHVTCCGSLREGLVLLLSDFLEKLLSRDELHHQVNVLLIVVSLVVLDDIWVIELMHNRDFLHDAVDVVSEFHFVHDLNGNLERAISLILSAEDTSESTNAQHLGIGVDMVILLKLVNTLLLISFSDFDIWTRNSSVCIGVRNALFGIYTAHNYFIFQIN